jgi:hypothetical protein
MSLAVESTLPYPRQKLADLQTSLPARTVAREANNTNGIAVQDFARMSLLSQFVACYDADALRPWATTSFLMKAI